MEKAPKKAQALQALCDGLGYDPEAAVSVHKGIFIERIESFLNEKKKITSDRFFHPQRTPCLLTCVIRLTDRIRSTNHVGAEVMDG